MSLTHITDIYTCIGIFAYNQTCLHACTHRHIHDTQAYAYIHVLRHIYKCTHMHSHSGIHTHIQSHAHKLRHTYTYVYINIHTSAHVLLAPTYAVMNTQVSSQRDNIHTCVYRKHIKKTCTCTDPQNRGLIHPPAGLLTPLAHHMPSQPLCDFRVPKGDRGPAPVSDNTPLLFLPEFVHLIIRSLWHGPLVFGFLMSMEQVYKRRAPQPLACLYTSDPRTPDEQTWGWVQSLALWETHSAPWTERVNVNVGRNRRKSVEGVHGPMFGLGYCPAL